MDELDPRYFDLSPDITRTPYQRREMVLHPNCPRDVVDAIARTEKDFRAIFSVLHAVYCDDEIEKNLLDNIWDIGMIEFMDPTEKVGKSHVFWKKDSGIYIDGLYEHFDYIHYPAEYKDAYTLITIMDNDTRFADVQVNTRVNIKNVMHLPDMIWWMRDQEFKNINRYINVAIDDSLPHYSIKYLPQAIKDDVIDLYSRFADAVWMRWGVEDKQWAEHVSKSLNTIIKYMNSGQYEPAMWDTCKANIVTDDNFYGIDWKKGLPDLARSIGLMHETEQRKHRTRLKDLSKKPKAT